MNHALSFLLAFLVVIGGRFLLTEAYLAPFPYGDTTFTEEFTWKEYKEIEVGMTQEQVQQLLGNPFASNQDWRGGRYSLKSGTMDGTCETYSRDGKSQWWDFSAWIGVNVCYDEQGAVIAKNELIHHD